MKVVVSGSRFITDYTVVQKAIQDSGFEITELVSGKEPNGVDRLGEEWAVKHGVPVKPFYADWTDIWHPDAIVKKQKGSGKLYDVTAGPRRNQAMAEYADALIAIPKDKSKGTRDMIKRAKKMGLRVFIVDLTDK